MFKQQLHIMRICFFIKVRLWHNNKRLLTYLLKTTYMQITQSTRLVSETSQILMWATTQPNR